MSQPIQELLLRENQTRNASSSSRAQRRPKFIAVSGYMPFTYLQGRRWSCRWTSAAVQHEWKGRAGAIRKLGAGAFLGLTAFHRLNR